MVAVLDGSFGKGKCRSGISPIVTSPLRRALAFGLVASLALTAPLVATVPEPALATLVAIGPFLVVTAIALAIPQRTAIFELFARPGDRRDGALYALAGFSLAAAGLAILTVGFDMPPSVYVGTVFLVAWGNFAGHLVRMRSDEPILATAGFVTGGFLAACGGQVGAIVLAGATLDAPTIAFLAASGSLIGALLREVLFQHDDALVLVTVGLLLWLLATITGDISPTRITVALIVTIGLGYVSYALETASLAGMLTGVLLGLLTIVLGDYAWFAMLIAFFGIGGLSSKFRYDDKLGRGIAQENEGARGTGNVLANSVVALGAVLGASASADLGLSESIFFFAFAGAVAAALADTLSSEIGGLYDNPRLITTLSVVDPGTDGAVTWQGTVVGVVGAGVVAAIAIVGFDGISLEVGGIIVLAGFAGMTADSLLGATIEGRVCGNQGVNFLATFVAALVGAALASALGATV